METPASAPSVKVGDSSPLFLSGQLIPLKPDSGGRFDPTLSFEKLENRYSCADTTGHQTCGDHPVINPK